MNINKDAYSAEFHYKVAPETNNITEKIKDLNGKVLFFKFKHKIK